MGLAALGEPVYADYLPKNVIRLLPNGMFKWILFLSIIILQGKVSFAKKTTGYLWRPRRKGEEVTKQHADVAASAQSVVEEGIFHLVNHLYKTTKLDTLCIGGGSCTPIPWRTGNCIRRPLLKRSLYSQRQVMPEGQSELPFTSIIDQTSSTETMSWRMSILAPP